MNVLIKFATILFVGLMVSNVSAYGLSSEKKQAKIVEKVSYKLELTDTQKTNFNNLLNEMRMMHEARKEQRKSNKESTIQLIESATSTADDWQTLMDARSNISSDNSANIATKIAIFHNSLTAEQKSKAAKMFERMLNRRGKHGRGKYDHDDE